MPRSFLYRRRCSLCVALRSFLRTWIEAAGPVGLWHRTPDSVTEHADWSISLLRWRANLTGLISEIGPVSCQEGLAVENLGYCPAAALFPPRVEMLLRNASTAACWQSNSSMPLRSI